MLLEFNFNVPEFKSQSSHNLSIAVARWNNGDIAALVAMFADDVAYCSPLVRTDEGSHWLQGSQEVAAHLLALRRQFERLEIAEVLMGAGFANLILRHDTGCISLLVEPDEDQRARRIIACHSAIPQ